MTTIHARDLSCQGLADVDPGVLDFHGQPVEGHVQTCELIGHLGDVVTA